MLLCTARYVAVNAHNSLMTTAAIKLMNTDEEREKGKEYCEAMESRKSCGEEAQAENVDLVSVKLGWKPAEVSAREKEKNIQETVGDKYRDRVARYQGIDPGYHRHIATRSDSRSGRVSSRSVALFVNAELRARARVTGSSRKASWGFMVRPPSPSRLLDQKRRRGVSEGERKMRCGRWRRRRWMGCRRVGQWTWYRPIRGKFRVALSHRHYILRRCTPCVPQSPPLFPRTAVKPLERTAYPSRVARFYEGWMDEWCEEPATHSCLHTPPSCRPPFSPISPVRGRFSPTTRLPKDEQIITPRWLAAQSTTSDLPLPRPLALEGKEREWATRRTRMPDLKPSDSTLYSLLYEL